MINCRCLRWRSNSRRLRCCWCKCTRGVLINGRAVARWGCGGDRPRMGTRARMLALFLNAGAIFGGASEHILEPDARALGVPFFQTPMDGFKERGSSGVALAHTHRLSLPLCKFIFTKCNVSQLVVVCLVIYFILILSCLEKQYVISRKQCLCVIHGQLLIYRWLISQPCMYLTKRNITHNSCIPDRCLSASRSPGLPLLRLWKSQVAQANSSLLRCFLRKMDVPTVTTRNVMVYDI
jgi:hypothetical protein